MAFPDGLDLSGATPFQRRVWGVTRLIPRGETRSYGWVAGQLGVASARAVGQALARNPLPVIVPCHRVVAADGGPGGYRGGLALKRRLLILEGCPDVI
ncbi:MAG: MGMT family protein [Chloroflexota bacterium]